MEVSSGGICPECRAPNPAEANFCQTCGSRLGEVAAPVGVQPPVVSAAPPTLVVVYAGFWRRFAAWLIDNFIILLPTLIIISFETLVAMGLSLSYGGRALVNLFGLIITIIGSWLYFSLCESSAKQATVGKMALGLVVTDLNRERISFGKATGRYWAKVLSSLILLIGFIMAGFTQKKQALHDILAETLVILKR
jgi:uncharacterized RDD family membrane protein YckC